ncbi:nucleoside monophosphate kinase [Candidatus Latescibacterota bacterium]
MIRYKAILLVGPTGSGKTPLGDICEENGLWGKRCAHFDFGASLRTAAETGIKPPLIMDEDMEVIYRALRSGALLENETFYIAKNILLSFAQEKKLGENDLLLLNGLPRHTGQAEDVDKIVEIKAVLHLNCSTEVVSERIKLNTGGDRAERIDDSPEEIERKLKIFEDRTIPLLDHYRRNMVRIEGFEVSVDTMPEDIYEWFNVKMY